MSKYPEILAYRINDACAAMGISRSTIYKLISEGKLKSISIGGRTVIPASEIRRLVAGMK